METDPTHAQDPPAPDAAPDAAPGAAPRPPAFRGDAHFRDDRFDDVRDRAAYGVPLADELAAAVDDRPLAAPGPRLGAFLLDRLLYGASLIPGLFLIAGSGIDEANPFGTDLAWMAVMGLGFAAAFGGNMWLLATTGQTVGKRLLRLRVVDVEDGSNPGFWRAVGIRVLVNWMIKSVVPFYSLVDSLFVFRDDRKCVHDHLAKTVVVTEAGR